MGLQKNFFLNKKLLGLGCLSCWLVFIVHDFVVFTLSCVVI